jgi:hypothetical protein
MGFIGARYSDLFILLAYLTVLSIAMIIEYQIIERVLMNEFDSTWKEVILA